MALHALTGTEATKLNSLSTAFATAGAAMDAALDAGVPADLGDAHDALESVSASLMAEVGQHVLLISSVHGRVRGLVADCVTIVSAFLQGGTVANLDMQGARDIVQAKLMDAMIACRSYVVGINTV